LKKGFVYGHKGPSSYQRVKLVEKRGNNISCVPVDDRTRAEMISADDTQLFELPPEFLTWSPTHLRIILANLRPPGDEPEYIPEQVQNAQIIVAQYDIKLMRGRVIGSRGSTIWVRPMITKEKCQNIRPLLIKHKGAVDNPAQEGMLIDFLLGLREKYHGHLELSRKTQGNHNNHEDEDDEEMFAPKIHKVQWAHLDLSSVPDELNLSTIKTTFASNPWEFYGINLKNSKMLRNLEQELHYYIEKKKESSSKEKENGGDFFQNLKPNSVVAAKEGGEDGKWARALIMDVNKEENTVQAFFVDFGDERFDLKASEVEPIPARFVERLPFQAVAFSLSHIQPRVGESWSAEEREAFLDLIIPDGNSVILDLIVSLAQGHFIHDF